MLRTPTIGSIAVATALLGAALSLPAPAQARGRHGGGYVGVRYGGFYGWGPGPYMGWGAPYWGWGWGPGPYNYNHGLGTQQALLGYAMVSGMGGLELDAKPNRAEVWVDGKYVADARDLDGYPSYLWLKQGAHHVVLYKAGYKSVDVEVDVRPGVLQPLKVQLEKGDSQPPVRAAAEPRPAEPRVEIAEPQKRGAASLVSRPLRRRATRTVPRWRPARRAERRDRVRGRQVRGARPRAGRAPAGPRAPPRRSGAPRLSGADQGDRRRGGPQERDRAVDGDGVAAGSSDTSRIRRVHFAIRRRRKPPVWQRSPASRAHVLARAEGASGYSRAAESAARRDAARDLGNSATVMPVSSRWNLEPRAVTCSCPSPRASRVEAVSGVRVSIATAGDRFGRIRTVPRQTSMSRFPGNLLASASRGPPGSSTTTSHVSDD